MLDIMRLIEGGHVEKSLESKPVERKNRLTGKP